MKESHKAEVESLQQEIVRINEVLQKHKASMQTAVFVWEHRWETNRYKNSCKKLKKHL